jgi:hypothetical protein
MIENQKEPFCYYIQHQTRINRGQVEPCCWFAHKTNAYNTNELAEYKKLITSIDKWGDECNHCWHLESSDRESPRTRAAKNPKNMFAIDETTGPSDIVSLEIQVDSECNAACIICGPWNSSTWQKYHSTETINKSEFNKKIDLNNHIKTKKDIDMIKQLVDFAKINQIVFLGGEPLINDTHAQLLSEITKHKSLDTVSLRYITNGSHRPTNETIDLWRQAKRINLLISLDGIGKHFNYHRWPLQWSQVEKNIEFFRDLNLPNLQLTISPTATPFNIFYFDQYLKWQEEFFKNHKSNSNIGFEAVHAAQGGAVNMYSVPPKLVDQLKIKFKNYSWLLATLENFDPAQYQTFMDYISFHDQKRGLDWKEYFPEIVEYFE